jgi:hydrogenase maturation protease
MSASRPVGSKPRILLLGYGNPAREDDGLGPAAAAAVEQLGLGHVTVSSNYQLTVEDAVDVAQADIVWFADASRTGAEPYELRHLKPARDIYVSSHLVQPEVVLALAAEYCGGAPEAYLLGIRGYSFDFREGLTAAARDNLKQAVTLMSRLMNDPCASMGKNVCLASRQMAGTG